MSFDVFAGLRVLDFSRVLAGPYATRLLADFGAEVIKVQAGKSATGAETNDRPYFAAWNRNKRSIVLDMDLPEARQAVLDLVCSCDIVVENFSPRVLDNWGLDYATLQQQNPAIILLRMSAAGQTGAWRNSVAFGPTIQALSGLTQLTACRDGIPIGPGFAYADVVAGLYGALAISSAVYSRARTGKGQYIDLSEYEALVGLLGPSLIAKQMGASEIFSSQDSTEAALAAPYGFYRCLGADRWCAIAVFDHTEWQALCEVLQFQGAQSDPRFATIGLRNSNSAELRSVIEASTRKRQAWELASQLQCKGVPAAVVQDAKDLSLDPQLVERGFFVRIKHPGQAESVSDRGAIRFGAESPPQWRPAPLLGQDTDSVLADLLGWSPDKIAAYKTRGIIG